MHVSPPVSRQQAPFMMPVYRFCERRPLIIVENRPDALAIRDGDVHAVTQVDEECFVRLNR